MSQAGGLNSSGGGGGGGITTIAGDTGTATGATITIFADVAAQNCGSTVQFTASGSQNVMSVTDPVLLNTFMGLSAGNATVSGIQNVGFGSSVFNSLTSGTVNVAVGRASLSSLTTGVGNVAVGANVLQSITSGSNNCCINSGKNYTSSESSNVLLQNNGVVGDNNIMRLGDNGSGAGQQNKCYIAGILANTVTNPLLVTIDSSTFQLGVSTAIPVITKWSDTSGTFTAASGNGYFITATSTSTLPASPTEGDTISFIVDSAQFLTITGNTGQRIRIGSSLSASAGTAVNTARGDSIQLVYRSTGTTWFSLGSPQGTWTVT